MKIPLHSWLTSSILAGAIGSAPICLNVQANSVSPLVPPLATQVAQAQLTVQDFQGFEGIITALSVTPDGKFLIVGTADNRISLIDLEKGKIVYGRSAKVNDFTNIAVSTDGKQMVTAGDDSVTIRQVRNGERTKVLNGHTGKVSGVALHPNGKQVVSVSGGDQTIRVWDLDSGDLIKTLATNVGPTNDVVFTPDGKYFITGAIGSDRTIKFWDAETFELFKTTPKQPGFVNALAVTPNNQKLVGAVRNFVKVWQLGTAQELVSVKGPSLEINTIAVSPDSTMVATANKEGSIMIFDVNTGQKITTLTGHEGWVLSVAFSPDGKTLFSGAEDKTVKVWRVEESQ